MLRIQGHSAAEVSCIYTLQVNLCCPLFYNSSLSRDTFTPLILFSLICLVCFTSSFFFSFAQTLFLVVIYFRLSFYSLSTPLHVFDPALPCKVKYVFELKIYNIQRLELLSVAVKHTAYRAQLVSQLWLTFVQEHITHCA